MLLDRETRERLVNYRRKGHMLFHNILNDYLQNRGGGWYRDYYKGAREQDRNTTLMSAIQAYSPSAPSTSSGLRGRPSLIPESPPTGVAKVLAGLAEIGIYAKPEDLAKLIPPDAMEPALVIMADVCAYFQGTFLLFPSLMSW
jgi:hypothetical protein